jgi:RNA polymerase sigma factor (sigma-70 family)
MSSYLQTSHDSDDRLGLLGELSRMSRELPGEKTNGLSQSNVEDFTFHWARAQLSVRAFLVGYLSDRSSIDDCIQEVALLAWKKGPRGTAETEHFLAFCLACARRIAMGEIRKKYRNRACPLSEETAASLADTVARMEQQESRDAAARISALQGCLESLEPGPRRLLELRYSSKDQTALQKESKATGKSMDAIYKKLERLRALLKDCVTRKSITSE